MFVYFSKLIPAGLDFSQARNSSESLPFGTLIGLVTSSAIGSC